MHKKLASLALLVAASLTSIPALAATNAITKTATAQSITIFSNGTGMPASTAFGLSSTDFPSGTLPATKTLTSLAYTIAAYPEALTDTVQLCYYRPYASSPSLCKAVTPGSTSTTTDFNKFQFGNGVSVRITHTTTGTAGSQLKPSRQESVTYTYSY
ncbi:hypothetical protein GQQ15_19735 [Pantoea agglomerans]|uniref:hypothetical protein n=1 Tax=Enterobacter agglomerans TaxID=549 RepID=UPI0013B70B7C|nr:hypothetical protein [Pantoea agglomerans]NEG87282.1 hypothetical protein [Pantoea agglomerans]NEH09616.1 hypothetical protein [Pantoea agglomerans]